jgi:hypothetical protein
VSSDEQLAWEARAGKPAAIAAFGAGLIALGAWAMYQSAIADREDGTDGFLKAINEDPSTFVTSGILQAIGFLLLIPPLLFLARAVRARRPEFSQTATILVVLGALGFAISTVVQQLVLTDVADDFFPFQIPDDASNLSGDAYAEAVDPEKAAEEAIRDDLPPAISGLGLGATFALAFAIVMIAMNAMRVGLLSRFMGVLGIAMGVMLILPLGIQPLLQLFWLSALGLLFLGRWPGAGRGPAWETGEPIPWPSAAGRLAPPPQEAAEPEQPPEPAERASPRPASRKRKKKRR